MWYALVQDEQLGPMPASEMQTLHEQKVVSGDTLVWRGGMGDWVPLCELPEFMHLFSEGDKTIAADFDALFDELDADDRTMLGDPLGDIGLGAAVDALFEDDPPAAASASAPAVDDEEMTIGAPAPMAFKPSPPSPFGKKPAPPPSPFAKKPAPPSPFGKRPAPPAPLGPKRKGPPGLPPIRSAAPPSPPVQESTMELGDLDLDALIESSPPASAESTSNLGEADLFGDLVDEAPAGGQDGTMELGDGDLFAGLADEVAATPGSQPLGGLGVGPAAPAPPAPTPPAPAPPTPPAPAPPAPPAPDAQVDFGASAPAEDAIDFGAIGGVVDPGPADPPMGLPPATGQVTVARREPEPGGNRIVLMVLALVVLGGGVGAAILMFMGGDDTPPPPDETPIRAVVADATPPPPPPEPDAAPPEPDAAPPVVDATVDAVVDAVVDATPPEPDAAKVAVRTPRPRPRPVRPRPTPPPPKSDKPVMLSRGDIKSVVDASKGKFQACSAETPAVKGKTVSVYLTIKRNGRVGRPRITTASVRGTEAEGCIENALKAMRFPEFTGDPMSFTLPIKL